MDARFWPLVDVPRLCSNKLWSTQENLLLVVSNSRNRWSGQPEYAHSVAIHEAGHALFFGLGNTIPEDLYAALADEIPTLNQEIAALNNSIGALLVRLPAWQRPTSCSNSIKEN